MTALHRGSLGFLSVVFLALQWTSAAVAEPAWMTAMKRGDYQTARRLALPLAEQGDAGAQSNAPEHNPVEHLRPCHCLSVRRTQGAATQMALHAGTAIETQDIIKYLNDQFYQFR